MDQNKDGFIDYNEYVEEPFKLNNCIQCVARQMCVYMCVYTQRKVSPCLPLSSDTVGQMYLNPFNLLFPYFRYKSFVEANPKIISLMNVDVKKKCEKLAAMSAAAGGEEKN